MAEVKESTVLGVACPQSDILRRLGLQVWLGIVFDTHDGPRRGHAHDALVHVASRDNLPVVIRIGGDGSK